MAKSKKKRDEKYEEKVAINSTFDEVIDVSVKPEGKKQPIKKEDKKEKK